MTLEYVASPHLARSIPKSRNSKVGAMSLWLYVLAFVNLAAAVTVVLASCPVWVFFLIFLADVAMLIGQSLHARSRP